MRLSGIETGAQIVLAFISRNPGRDARGVEYALVFDARLKVAVKQLTD